MSERTPVVVVGPGAIGGAVAAGLFQAGGHPVMAVRTPFDHLVVDLPDGRIEESVVVMTDPAVARPADLVVLAVKAHQTADAAPWLQALVDERSVVCVLQNGVEHTDRVASFVPREARVVPIVVALPAQRRSPGVIEVTGRARLTAPPGPGADALARALAGSFVEVKIDGDWVTAAWVKLMMNAASGGMCTIAKCTNGVFVDDGEARAVAVELMAEVAAVGRAEGATLSDDLPERLMDGMLQRAGGHMSSIVVDRLNGVPTEWEARNEVVVRLARRHGIDVPRNRLLTTLLRLTEP